MNKALRFITVFCLLALLLPVAVQAQCSICTRTAEQMGETIGKGLNAGILYLAAAPLSILGVIAYKWRKANKS